MDDEVVSLGDGIECRVWYFDWHHIDGFLKRTRRGDWLLGLSQHLSVAEKEAAFARCRQYVEKGIDMAVWPNSKKGG